jgi:hypothetical protein
LLTLGQAAAATDEECCQASLFVRHLVLSHLQIEGENRSWLRGSKQACEKWTLTGQMRTLKNFPDGRQKFPVTV